MGLKDTSLGTSNHIRAIRDHNHYAKPIQTLTRYGSRCLETVDSHRHSRCCQSIAICRRKEREEKKTVQSQAMVIKLLSIGSAIEISCKSAKHLEPTPVNLDSRCEGC